ncbi:MAG: hypothetical protein EBW88_10310, partial [Betaproteobacteria bacterium]|nr:hypothetical protein [Betaproteobacteria bacterium]
MITSSPALKVSRRIEHPGQFSVGTTLKNWSIFVRHQHRQYMALPYRSSMDAIIEALPEPLEPDGDIVAVQWLDLPDGEGELLVVAVAPRHREAEGEPDIEGGGLS